MHKGQYHACKCANITPVPDLVVVDQLVKCNLSEANVPEGSR